MEPGEYNVRLYGSAAGRENELVFEGSFAVEAQEATPTPEAEETPSPTEQAPAHKPFLDLSSVPIGVWFAIGAAVVVILIAIIIHILKHG